MRKVCEQCGQKNCGFVNRGMEDDCEKVQLYEQGYAAAVDKTCEWLKKNTYSIFVQSCTLHQAVDRFVENYKQEMEGGEE